MVFYYTLVKVDVETMFAYFMNSEQFKELINDARAYVLLYLYV